MKFSKSIRRAVNKLATPVGHVDAIAGNRISGWACAYLHPICVEVRVGDHVVASVKPHIERLDVALDLPNHHGAQWSGFIIEFPASAVPEDELVEVSLEIRPLTILARPATLAKFVVAGPKIIAAMANAPETGMVGPYPKHVIDAVAAVWPDACRDLVSAAGQRIFLERLKVVLAVPALRGIPAIANYVRYLSAITSHFRFVDRHFPTENSRARENALDFHCKPNSVFEIMSIAHQLYILQSYGVAGDFAEFGCFKGFSSSMLSFACQQLGLKMHIFDSFEGLPEAEGSGYVAGDYAGSLDEVTENVTRFGAVSVVDFHRGFFADTFKSYRPPNLLCLWMDVDLEVSSRDLMVVADLLDPRSTLFSHECVPDLFQDGEIVASPSPDNPIPPMLERFNALGRPLTGRFLRGNTGAFWPKAGGVPALDNIVLAELAAALSA